MIEWLIGWLILDEKYEDVLVNVNIMDTERTKKNLENIKSHAGYQAYDQEEVDELTGYICELLMPIFQMTILKLQIFNRIFFFFIVLTAFSLK